jgi:hypothetical protein
MQELLSLEDIVNWDQPLTEAKQRIPDELRGNSFFSTFDLYTYKAITDDRTCNVCMQFDNMIIQGDIIRAYYPYLEIISTNQMLPHVHPRCRCTLLRVTDLSDYITYTDPIPEFPSVKGIEPTKQVTPTVITDKQPNTPRLNIDDLDDDDILRLYGLGFLGGKKRKQVDK